ncbi:plasmid pRiA4b ORF-3 family protein [Flavobacteriaceae bacterium]|jgi:hypothetical protein|nr:plasmid pRiA4b ORF-3 family protein [Flavobacteriaceae bacterium]
MIYRLRIILDVKEDVLRDIEIEDTATFEDLHHAITQAFGFLGNEMASFYLSNENWEQGEELPLEAMDISQESFQDKELNTIISATQHQLIYVYDFLNLWTFFVELMEVGELVVGTIYPNLIHAQGDVPEEAPEKIFESQNSEGEDHEGDFEEEDTDDYDENEFY